MEGDSGGTTGGPTPYDALPYISGARNATSVDRLATIGRLLALPAADPEACRVLELGCGDGGNLIPMAISFPGSEFLGVDLAPTAIARGRSAIEAVGLSNIRLLEASFGDVGGEFSDFDFIIAHGVYSWVPEAVREQLLAVIRARLRPAGIAFVSYNAQPGSQVRGVLRQMMLLHTRAITDPRTKIEQARALLRMLMHAPAEAADVYRPLLKSELGKALQTSDSLLYHDDLAETSEPFFFADFMAAAQRHGLQFAAEANFFQMSLANMPPEIAGPLGELGQQDLIGKEQYLDFMTCRSFRQTLLCREEAQLDRGITTERVRQFRVASDAQRTENESLDAGVAEFRASNTSTMRTDDATAIKALATLRVLYPRSLPFNELAAMSGAASTAAAETLAEILFRAYGAGLVSFRLSEPGAVFVVSARPVASPWARLRAETGQVVNLYHETIGLEEVGSAVLALLDGRRTLAEVAVELGREESEVVREAEGLAAHGLLLA